MKGHFQEEKRLRGRINNKFSQSTLIWALLCHHSELFIEGRHDPLSIVRKMRLKTGNSLHNTTELKCDQNGTGNRN